MIARERLEAPPAERVHAEAAPRPMAPPAVRPVLDVERVGYEPPDERWASLPRRIAEAHLRAARLRADGRRVRGTVRLALGLRKAGIGEDEYRSELARYGQALQAWLREGIGDAFVELLPDVHAALFEAATGGQASAALVAAARTYLERFDSGFKPTSRHELSARAHDPEAERLRALVRSDPVLRARFDAAQLEGGEG